MKSERLAVAGRWSSKNAQLLPDSATRHRSWFWLDDETWIADSFGRAQRPLDNRTLTRSWGKRLRLNCDGSADHHGIEEFTHIAVLERDATPCPIAAGAAPMDVDVATQASVLGRRLFGLQSAHDRIVLRSVNQSVAQAAFSVRSIWIRYAEGKIKRTLVVFGKEVEIAFRRPPISLPDFVADRTQAEANAIDPDQFVSVVKVETPFTFLHDDAWRGEFQLSLLSNR